MQKYYSIIIPIYNELLELPKLLQEIHPYHLEGHELIIVDDGSIDKSHELLSNCDFINLISFKTNKGKGIALKEGLKKAKNERIIIFDGDRELYTNQIKKLMILDDSKKNESVFATRFDNIKLDSFWNLGNLLLTNLFNLFNNSDVKDALCCAKAFYKSNISINRLTAKKFNIDVEIAGQLVQKHDNVINILIQYNRRNKKQGKKLRFRDGFSIIFQVVKDIKIRDIFINKK